MIESKKVDWLSISPGLASIQNVLAASQDEIKKKNFTARQSLLCAIKREWKSSAPNLTTTLVHSINNRVSQIIKSDGDFILC